MDVLASMPGFLSLSNELLCEIFQKLSQRDLYSCTQLCRDIAAVTIPLLYTELTLTAPLSASLFLKTLNTNPDRAGIPRLASLSGSAAGKVKNEICKIELLFMLPNIQGCVLALDHSVLGSAKFTQIVCSNLSNVHMTQLSERKHFGFQVFQMLFLTDRELCDTGPRSTLR